MVFSLLNFAGKRLVEHMDSHGVCHGVIDPAFSKHRVLRSCIEVVFGAVQWCCTVCHWQVQYPVISLYDKAFKADYPAGVVKSLSADQFGFIGAAPELFI